MTPSKKKNCKKQEKHYTFESYCITLRGLVTYRDLSEEDFFDKAKKSYADKYGVDELKKYVPNYQPKSVNENSIGVWKDEEEADEALTLYTAYSKNKEFTEISDKELLKQLIYIEIRMRRIQKNTDDKKHRHYIELNNQAIALKKTLGLLDEGKNDDVADRLKQLQRKASVWREKNRLAFEARCAHCGKMNLLRMRTKLVINGEVVDAYDAIKHPFFKDRVLCNEPLWDLYREGRITKMEMAKILFGEDDIDNVFYVDWLEEKMFGIQQKQQETQEEVDSGQDEKKDE